MSTHVRQIVLEKNEKLTLGIFKPVINDVPKRLKPDSDLALPPVSLVNPIRIVSFFNSVRRTPSVIMTTIEEVSNRLAKNEHRKEVRNRFKEMFDKGIHTDVTFMCEDQCMAAHRMVLAAGSKYLAELFEVWLIVKDT